MFGDTAFHPNNSSIRSLFLIMATPSEEALRIALASILLKDGSDDEGVVDGIDGTCMFAKSPS